MSSRSTDMEEGSRQVDARGDYGLHPVTIKILWDRLTSIVEEATVAQYRTAFSTVVQEANDFACSLMHRHGGTLASSEIGLPSFVATQAITLSELLRTVPLDEMRDGDVFITNDPWIATGQAMDLTLISPIVRNGRVVAFAGSVAHAPDLGGAQKWNLSTDVFVEAIRLPLMRFSKGGERDETLYELLKANSRLPELMAGDLEAQLAAMRLIRERVLELLDEYRLDNIDAVAEAIFGRSEHAMRLAVDAIPDGRYGGEVRSDSFPSPDGEPPTADGEPIVIKVAVDVRGSDVTMDFTGSSAERPGSFNSVWTFTSAYALYALRLILVPYVSNNAGFYRPVTVVCPEGTVVNARYPAATLSRHVIGHQVVDAVYAALAPVLPDRVIAEGGSTPSWDLLLMGEDADGRAFHRLVIVNGGTGASPNQDGATCCFPANLSNTPIEVLERLMPIACECKEIIADSAGAGRRRGGFGQRLVLRALAPVKFSLINARVRNAPKGLLGGSAARAGRALARGEELPPGSDGLLGVGETLEIDTPGGGGVGDERERDPVLVERDLAQGFVTSRPLEESLFSDAAQEC